MTQLEELGLTEVPSIKSVSPLCPFIRLSFYKINLQHPLTPHPALTDLALIGEKTDYIWSCCREERWDCLPHRMATSGDPECAWPQYVMTAHTFLDFIPSLSSARSQELSWLTSPPQIPLLPHSDSSHGDPSWKGLRVLYSFYVQVSSCHLLPAALLVLSLKAYPR